MGIEERLCALVLRMYPRAFRERFGADLAQALADDLRDARALPGRTARGWARATSLGDLMLGAFSERGREIEGAVLERGSPVLVPTRPHTPRRNTMDQLTQDLRSALRNLTKNPGSSALIVLILALGIGANAALLSVVDGVLLRPLPFEEPQDLVAVWGTHREMEGGRWWTSYPDFVDFEKEVRSFRGMAAFRTPRVNLVGPEGDPERLPAARVTHDLLDVLGIEPTLGRGFLPEEDQPGGATAVILGHGLWQRRYGGAADILGQRITLNSVPHTVVGVLPAGFRYPQGSEVWLPAAPDVAEDYRGMHRLQVIARLAPGTTAAEASVEMRAVARRLEEAYPESNTDRSAWVQPLHEAEVGRVEPALLTLLGAVALVLLIACANVANLLLARSATRGREMALRSTLGATRGRLVRQLLTESTALALAGGAAGCALGHALLKLLIATSPVTIPRLSEVSLDGRVLAAMTALSLLTGIVFGLVPALRTSHSDLRTALDSLGRGAGLGLSKHRLQRSLAVFEIALAVVLVSGAGLLIRSFQNLHRVDPGFDPENLLSLRLSLPADQFEAWPQVVDFYERLEERAAHLPGVRSVASAYAHPLDPAWTTGFAIEGVLEPPPGQLPEAVLRPVTPGYFATAGVPLLAGRAFDERDTASAPGAVIVNEAFVRHFFGDADPLGHRLVRNAWWEGVPASFEIVGVVADVRFAGLQAEAPWAMYYPHRQVPMNDMYLLVKTEGDPLALAGALRAEVWALDRDLPVDSLRTMEEILAGSVGEPRFQMQLLGAFAGLALLLAAAGVYGVISQTVSQRTGEIGLRLALGARHGQVFAMVIRQGLRLTLGGVLLGLLAALWAVRALASFLYGIAATDPLTMGAVVLVLSVVALVAAFYPAQRAMRVDPVVALRDE